MSTPFVPCPNVAELDALYMSAGQPVENVFHFLGTGAWNATSLTALMAAYVAWENTNGKTVRSDNVILVSTRAVDLTTQNGPGVEGLANITGTLSPGHLPNNATLCLKQDTGLRGRSFRGRTYHIGLNLAQLDASGNFVTTVAAGNLVAAYNALLSTAWPNGAKLVVVSKRANKAWRAQGVATPVNFFTNTDLAVDSQKRRLPAHNRHRK